MAASLVDYANSDGDDSDASSSDGEQPSFIGPAPRPTPAAPTITNFFSSWANKRKAAAVASDTPELAAHERGRATKTKTATSTQDERGAARATDTTVNRRGPGRLHVTVEPKTATVADRIGQFPNQSLKDSAGKLYCACC